MSSMGDAQQVFGLAQGVTQSLKWRLPRSTEMTSWLRVLAAIAEKTRFDSQPAHRAVHYHLCLHSQGVRHRLWPAHTRVALTRAHELIQTHINTHKTNKSCFIYLYSSYYYQDKWGYPEDSSQCVFCVLSSLLEKRKTLQTRHRDKQDLTPFQNMVLPSKGTWQENSSLFCHRPFSYPLCGQPRDRPRIIL